METKNSLKTAFNKLSYEPKENLSLDIWTRILKRKKQAIRFRLYAFSSLGIISLFSFVPVFKALFTEFAQSGFSDYLSLAFSNGSSLVVYWKDLALSLVESLPIFDVVLSFGIVLFSKKIK